jgi:hypothetical protein
MASDRPYCRGCKGQVNPVLDVAKGQLLNFYTCEACASTGKTSHFSHPFDYIEMFKGKGYVFLHHHPDHPKAFRDTDRDRLPPNLQRALGWKPEGKKGLLLHGVTGAGKTRTAWEVFNRLWLFDFPDKAVWLPMRKLEGAIEKGFDDHKHGKVVDYFCQVPLLALDDLGKERLTARMETDLFAILDERTSNLRTTIITTNYNGTTLLDRFHNKETGEAFLRRLREYFDAFHA